MESSGREIDLITLKAGEYFGEMALMLNDTRHANVIAVGKVRCLSLSASKFNLLLGSVQDVLAKRMRIRILQHLVYFMQNKILLRFHTREAKLEIINSCWMKFIFKMKAVND